MGGRRGHTGTLPFPPVQQAPDAPTQGKAHGLTVVGRRPDRRVSSAGRRARYSIGVGGRAIRQSHWSRVPPTLKDGAPAREVGVRRVLLLNITYEPLTTVGLHRAVCLVLGEKAEVVHDDSGGAVLRSASVILATPSVIRLRRYIRVPHRSRVPLTRAALMRRDNYLCAYSATKAA